MGFLWPFRWRFVISLRSLHHDLDTNLVLEVDYGMGEFGSKLPPRIITMQMKVSKPPPPINNQMTNPTSASGPQSQSTKQVS